MDDQSPEAVIKREAVGGICTGKVRNGPACTYHHPAGQAQVDDQEFEGLNNLIGKNRAQEPVAQVLVNPNPLQEQPSMLANLNLNLCHLLSLSLLVCCYDMQLSMKREGENRRG